MKRLPVLLSMIGFFTLAQLPDLDDFGGDLELPASESTPGNPEISDVPPNHLFASWDLLKEIPGMEMEVSENRIINLVLPEGNYLVAPNVPSIASGYQKISETVRQLDLEASPFLKVVLHADGNFSVALFLNKAPDDPIPVGVDLSPLPETHLGGILVDLENIDRTNPKVVEAFQRLSQLAREVGWELDRREFFFLPLEPGRVFFGLKRNLEK